MQAILHTLDKWLIRERLKPWFTAKRRQLLDACGEVASQDEYLIVEHRGLFGKPRYFTVATNGFVWYSPLVRRVTHVPAGKFTLRFDTPKPIADGEQYARTELVIEIRWQPVHGQRVPATTRRAIFYDRFNTAIQRHLELYDDRTALSPFLKGPNMPTNQLTAVCEQLARELNASITGIACLYQLIRKRDDAVINEVVINRSANQEEDHAHN